MPPRLATALLIPFLWLATAKEVGRRGEEPRFLGQIDSTIVPIGREATLSCTVDNKGHYKVGWMRVEDGTVLSLDTKVVTQSVRVSVSKDDSNRTWTLRIRPLRESDRGCYMCQINTSIMMKQIGCIDVHIPPDIIDEGTSGDVRVKEGQNASMSCKARGHPQPRILWRREDASHILLRPHRHQAYNVESYSGDVLPLTRIDRSQMGAYLCIASNDVPPAVSKRINLYVEFAPSVRVPSQLKGSPVGRNVTLTCQIEAFPNSVYYWAKNRRQILTDGPKYLLDEIRLSFYKVLLNLTLLRFEVSDIATYDCIAANTHGRSENSIRLYEVKIITTTTTTTTTTTEPPELLPIWEEEDEDYSTIPPAPPYQEVDMVTRWMWDWDMDNRLDMEEAGSVRVAGSSFNNSTTLHLDAFLPTLLLYFTYWLWIKYQRQIN